MTAVPANAPVASGSLVARLRPLQGVLGPHRLLVWYAIACGMAYQVVALAVAGTAAWLVGQAATGASAAQLRGGLILLGALVVPAALLRWGDWYLAHVAAYLVLADMRSTAYAAFERLSPGYLLERRSGDLGAAVMSDIEMLEGWIAHTLSPLVVAATVPLAALVALAVFDPAIALALVPVLAMLVSIPAWLRRQAAAQGDEMRARLGELNAETVDVFQGLRELVTFGARRRRLERVADQDDALLAAKVAHGRRAGLEHAATDVLTVLGLVAVLVVAAVQVTRGQLEPALFPVAVILAATTFMPVLAVLDVFRELNLVGAAAKRVTAILDAPAPVVDLVSEPPPGPIQPAVRFEDVSFRYASTLPDAVDGVSFEIAPGETVALVGHSGAGKSTCAHLLLRLWDVGQGAIRIGGHDVRAFPQESLRELLTFVPQDVFRSMSRCGITSAWPVPTRATPRSRRRLARRWPTSSSPGCRTATTPSPVSWAPACPAANGNASRWPGRYSRTRRSWSWTRPCPIWTPPASKRSPSPWPTPAKAAPHW